jgi:hypothetical protein
MKFDNVFIDVLLEKNKCVEDFNAFDEEHVWKLF